jgi:SAM-dependent methyltransferase
MVESKAWKWDQISEPEWSEPAQDVYYLAARWQRDHRTRLLDLGCGIGRHSIFFAEQRFSVDAYDLSESGIAALGKTAHERNLSIRARVGDMLTLPYASESFDCVLSFHVIYHTNKAGIERVISEIDRVLVRGGEVYLTFNSLSNPIFSDPQHRRIDKNTIVKTDGIEVGVPHYGVDEPEIRRLMSSFEFIRLTHVEEIWGDYHSWHYFVLAKKL